MGKGLVKTIPYYFTDPGAVASPSTDVHAFLAQLVERTAVNRVVVGSSPIEGAIRTSFLIFKKSHKWIEA